MSLLLTSIVTESNSFRINFVAGSPPAGAHTNSVMLFVNEKNSSDYEFPIYTIFESSIAADADIPNSFLIELEDPSQFNVGDIYVMSISQSFSDGTETVSNTMEEEYVLNAKPLQPVIYGSTGIDVASGDQVVSFYLDTGASQGSAMLSITGRSFKAAGQYVTHQCPINASTLTRAGSSGMNMKVRKTISSDPEHGDNLYYCVLLNLENGVQYEHRFSTINAVGKSESCDVFISTPTNQVLEVTGFALDSSILEYKFTASWPELVIPNHDDFESIVTGYKLEYDYTDASYNVVMSTFDASSNTLAFESQSLQVAEAASGVSVVNGTATSLTSTQMTLAKADSAPALITAGIHEDGWTIDNAGGVADASGNFPKVNLYFYGNTVAAASQNAGNSFTLADATGLGLYAIFDQAAGAREYPFFNAYTTPSGSVNKADWYKSKVLYGAASSGDTVADPDKVGLTLAYTGTDNPAIFPHIENRVKYEVKVGTDLTNAYAEYATELVNYLTLQTSSQAVSAGSYNFRLLETGMFTSHASFGQLRLLYNLTGKVAATIYATTNNSGDGALSDVQSIRVFDTPKCLCSQDYDYTITAVDKGISVSIALDADALAYLSNRSTLTHIVIGVRDASSNPIQDASSNPIQDASYNVVGNALNLNHSFTRLTNGVHYIIRMQLVASNPNSSESSEVIYGDVENVPDIVPFANADALVPVTATGSDGKVTFEWPVVSDDQLQGGTFVKYVIKYQGSSGTDLIYEETNINATSHELTGLTNGTTYYFTFYVVTLDPNTDDEENGDATDLSQIPFKAADAPASISLTPGDAQMMVDWPDSHMNGSDFQYYLVELFSGSVGSGSSVKSAQVTASSHTFTTGLTNGTSYYATVTVYAKDPNDSSISVTGGSITSSSKIPFRAADAPASVTLTPGNQQMQVEWSTAELNGGVFSSFVVVLFNGGGVYSSYPVNSASTLSHTFTGLTNGTSYYATVTVYTTDPNLSSPYSSNPITSSSKIPFRAADAPTSTSITLTPGNEQMMVDWPDAEMNGSVFAYYLVDLFSGAVGSGSFVKSAQVTASIHTFTELTNGTSYYATVTVYTTDPNNSSSSYASNPVNSSSSQIPFRVPNAPASVTLTPGNAQMTVHWSATGLNGSVFTEYLVELSPGSYSITLNESTFSHTFTDLDNGTSYYGKVTVYAKDPNDSSIVISGGSTYSNTKIAFANADPPTLAIYPGYQTIQVDWSDIETNGSVFVNYTVELYERISVDASGNNVLSSLLSDVEYTILGQDTHTFTDLTIGVNYVVKVIVVTSNPNDATLIADGPAGSIVASPHDNPIIIGSAMIDNSSKTVSVTVDKNGSNITDYMAIVQPGTLMQKINNSSPVANLDGTYTLSLSFPSLLSNITSALMVVGNGGGFTAVEFNGSTQTVLSPEHYRALP